MEKMSKKPHYAIVKSCEGDLKKYGDNFRGVGWTKKKEYADLRYRVMTEIVRETTPVTLLDVGCGASHLLEYINFNRINHIAYSGLDISNAFLDVSKNKFPEISYYDDDILSPECTVPNNDYIVMNGLFNWKGEMSQNQMWDYFQTMILKAFTMADKGIAFNVMSKYLDWERDDLFHLPFDELASFLDRKINRSFTIRHDYGLYEYTVYVYKTPLSSEP